MSVWAALIAHNKKPATARTVRVSLTIEPTKEKMIHAMLPLARGNDPITSFQAADSAKAFIRSHEAKIIETLSANGAMGVDVIALHTGLKPHAVGKRMKALHDRGEVELTGFMVKGDSGRDQREWVAT